MGETQDPQHLIKKIIQEHPGAKKDLETLIALLNPEAAAIYSQTGSRAREVLDPSIPEGEWEDSFEVQGSFYYGKDARFGDYDAHDKQGEFDTGSIQGVNHMTKAAAAGQLILQNPGLYFLLYEQEGNDRVVYRPLPAGADSDGRPMSGTNVLRTSSNVHPFTYLTTLARAKLGNMSKKNYPDLGSEISIDDRARKDLEANDTMHDADATRIANKAFATYLLGEASMLSRDSLLAVCRNHKCMQFTSPVILAAGEGETFVPRWLKSNEYWTEGAIVATSQDYNHHLSQECTSFLDQVEERFGEDDAHFELLLSSNASLQERKDFLVAFFSGNLQDLSEVTSDVLPWVEAVGTADEIALAKSKVK